MSTATVLFLIFIAIYLIECCRWWPHETVAFVARFGRWRKFTLPSASVGTSHYGLVFCNPFLLHPPTLATVGDPFAISPFGLVIHQSEQAAFSTPQRESARFCPWSTLDSFHIKGRSVCIGNQSIAHFVAPSGAERVLNSLRDLAGLNMSSRETHITEWIAAAFDHSAAKEKIARFESKAYPQGLVADVLFFSTLIIVPFVAGASNFAAVGLAAILFIALLSLTCGILHYRNCRKWTGMDRTDAAIEAIRVGVYPPAALRSFDSIGERLVEEFHPLAVAAAVCDPKEFETRANMFLRVLNHGSNSHMEHDTPTRDTIRWYQNEVAAQVYQLLRSTGLEPESTVTWRGQRDPSAGSYCPTCNRQYVQHTGNCSDCMVPLRSFE